MRRMLMAAVLAAGGVISFTAGAVTTPLVSEAGLPVVKMGELSAKELGKGWSGAQTDGDIAYRLATKGGERTFKVKAWWDAKALRPPENAIYILTVYYKDTARKPAIFSSFMGLGDMSVLHRFGGTGDGQWKTAAVPVSWDYVIRTPGDREYASFGLTTDEDLPVAAVTMSRATKADEEKYNAETRAWVAAVQAPLATNVTLKVEAPKFKAPANPIVAFPWPALSIMKQDVQPKTEQIGAPIKIRMCMNEIEGGSFGVYANGADLAGVDYTVSELKGDAGSLKADVIRRTAEYCLVQTGYLKTAAHKWFPQRLWPAYPVNIAQGRSHWFLVNLRTKRGETKPGLYKGEVTIAAGAARATLPIQVEVLPVNLLTMDEAGLTMGGCVAGRVSFHDVAFQVDYNQNGDNAWVASVAPEMSLKDGKLVLDWTYMDEWMRGAKQRGQVNCVWFFGGNPYGFPRTMTLERRLYDLLHPNDKTGFVKKMSSEEWRDKMLPDLRPLYVDFFRQLYAHYQTAGWPEPIVTPFDEPAKFRSTRTDKRYPDSIGTGPWIKPQFKEQCKAIREGAPNLRIYGSIHHHVAGLAFINDIDVFCTNTIEDDPALGDKVRAAGRTFWQYSGMYKNEPEFARYTFGFFFGAYNSRGSLCWAYNWGSGFDTTKGNNWSYAWQTPFDTIPAPYFEGMREAWDDRRVIETYKKSFANDKAAMDELARIFKAAEKSKTDGGADKVDNFWTGMDDAAKLDAWRNRLLDRLVKAARN